jgi:CHAD domain-containing protein
MPDETSIPELLQQPVDRAAREVALRLLDKAGKERHRLDDAGDPEALHDFRVAVRRLRSWLKAFKEPLRGSVSGKHRDLLRAVAHATNTGRDAEVHIEWLRAHSEFFRRQRREGTEWLIERLQSKHTAAEDALREVEQEGVCRNGTPPGDGDLAAVLSGQRRDPVPPAVRNRSPWSSGPR